MLLRHATLARNLPSIIKAGLLTSKSRGKLPAVWLCSAAKTLWAAAHVVRRHGGRIESVVVLEIDVPRRRLRRSKKGLWYCPRDVPPERIRGVVTFAALARSPVGETAG
jgi:RNA:NAD 2'-phosphotransferase (TPT1/KptA family)